MVGKQLERERTEQPAGVEVEGPSSPLRFRDDGIVTEGPAVPVIPPAGVRRARTPGARPGTMPPPPPPVADAPAGNGSSAAPPAPAPPLAPPPVAPSADGSRLATLRDRAAYLKNFWYAAALSSDVGTEPHGVTMLDLSLVLFRDASGVVQALPDACPHRGAPLSRGWTAEKGGASCVVCPYHGWAIDGQGKLREVPANTAAETLPSRPVLVPASVTERGGFVWLFYGDAALPPDARPPLPLIPELEDEDTWQPVYGSFEFDAPHTSVFENAIDFAHIHYLHGSSFGNADAPAVRDMRTSADAYGVRVSFTIQNKPVSWLWEWSRVPEVQVHAQAMLPGCSVVAFELAYGVSMITFVCTTPISATRSVNRFALVRNFSKRVGPAPLQAAVDAFARRAMVRILTEDKAMVETLRPEAVAREVNVRADAAQLEYRRLRQSYIDMGYGVAPKSACDGRSSGC
jgi:phenylpropionate dioxygenase-like ring-hydroxylating dioxygenase large terminal subunit